MSYSVKITSMLTHPAKLSYRMPKGGDGKLNPVITIPLRDREWMLPVNFPSEQHFEEFKRQNADFIKAGYIKFGEVKVKEAQDTSKKIAKESSKAMEEKIDKAEENLMEMTDERVNISVEKEEPKPRKNR